MIRFVFSGFCFAALVVWLFVCLVLLRMPWAKVLIALCLVVIACELVF